MTTSEAAGERETARRADEVTAGRARMGPGNAALVAAACALAVLGTMVFAGGLLAGAPLLLYGGALGLALFALAFAVRRLFAAAYPRVELTEERHSHDEGGGGPLSEIKPIRRRSLLQRMLVGAAAVLGVGFLAPVTTLGPRPLDVQRGTGWRAGVRVVDPDERPLRVADVPPGGLAIVWPEGDPRDDDTASVILVRLPPGLVEPPTNPEWVVDDELVAYSKVCTHVGCPVGLFQARTGSLFCPCHQQVFDARRAATPTFGPAARALPQLPLGVDDEGYLIALGDFVDPVGPAVG